MYFAQRHRRGEQAQSDFTYMGKLGVTIAGEPFGHLLYHFVLPYSNFKAVSLCFSKTLEAFLGGLQAALWQLGGVPREHRTDNLSAATHELQESRGRGFTSRYRELLDHYGVTAEVILPISCSDPDQLDGRAARDVLAQVGHDAAANEIHEALQDVSRRAEPDETGALQHAIAALACTAREVTGEPPLTLGRLVPRQRLAPPLDTAIEKLWGYASDRARHIREGRCAKTEEAQLIVSVACSVCKFLFRRSAPNDRA